MAKIYISPERREKPHGKFWGFDKYESDYCYEIANRIGCMLLNAGHNVRIPSKNRDMYKRVEDANNWGADYYLCIHTNASTDGTKEGTAKGYMIIRCGKENSPSDYACKSVANELRDAYWSISDYGVVANTGNFYEIDKSKAVSAYCEIGFHDNSDDGAWLLNSKKAISYAIARGVQSYLGESQAAILKNQDIFDVPFYDDENTPENRVPSNGTNDSEQTETLTISDFFDELIELLNKYRGVIK